jgi:hypothetical protein
MQRGFIENNISQRNQIMQRKFMIEIYIDMSQQYLIMQRRFIENRHLSRRYISQRDTSLYHFKPGRIHRKIGSASSNK